MPDREPMNVVVLSEITGLRKLVTLGTTIIIALILISIGAQAFRIYLIESRLRPMQKELDSLYKELDYDCKYTKHDSRIQCGVRPTRQRVVDGANDQ